MDVLVHIGSEKTGTTTIQNFLSSNRAILAANDVLVPVTPGWGNHRLLPGMVNDPEFIDDLFRERDLLDADDRAKAKKAWQGAFREEIIASQLSRCILSSEHLQSRLRTNAEVSRLGALLRDLFGAVTIILYIRDPIATAVSLYSTGVKYGAESANVPGPNDHYCRQVVNHAATIRLWTSIFGERNIRVRLFSHDAFAGGDLIDDFIEVCQLPKADYRRPAIQNESLSALGIAILRKINRRIPAICEDGTANRSHAGLAEFFSRHFSVGPRYVPPREKVEAYNKAFAESNEWVRKHYFPERTTLFQCYIPPAGSASPVGEVETQAIADAIAELWMTGRDR